MRNRFICFFIFLFQNLCIAQKNDANSKDTISVLKEVFVTATKAQQNLINIPYAVSKITADHIQDYSFRTSPEALVGTTGIFIQKTNHGGGSPFVRGLTGNQNLLLIDGIRLNNATYRYGPNQYLNTIDLYNVAAIEVVRGTGSVQYGSDAMGGVIQVFTKEPVFSNIAKWSSTVYGKTVSANMELSGRAELRYQSKKIAFQAGFSNRNFGNLVGGDTTGIQNPSGYNENAFDAKFRWKLNTNTLLIFAHQQQIQHNVPLYHRVKLENFNYFLFEPQQRNLSYLRVEKSLNGNFLNKIVITASSQLNKETRKYSKNNSIYELKESDKIATLGVTADFFSIFSKTFNANSGLEYYHDQVNSSKSQTNLSNGTANTQRGLYPNNSKSDNFSIYSLYHFSLKKIQVEAGIRYNQFAINITDTSSGYTLGSVTIKPSSLVANFSVMYKFNNSQSLYGSFSSGYRSPNIDDMGTLGLVDFRYEIPAYELKPEKSFNTEIGYRFINKKIKLSVALFNMQLTNLITRVQIPALQVGGYNVYTKANNQNAYVRGFEIEYMLNLTPKFSFETNATYTFGQNISNNEPMRRVPPFNGKVALNFKHRHWKFCVENLYATIQNRLAQGDKDDNRIPVGGTPGWNVLNIYGGYQFKLIHIQTGSMNLFNKDYRTHGSGINGAGRHFYFGFNITI